MTVRVPATSANLGPGFDVMGLALPLYNRLTVTLGEVTAVTHEGRYGTDLPVEDDHLSLRAARRLADAVGRDLPNGHWRIDVEIPPSRGMGSSSAAIVGGLVAANALLGTPLDRHGLLQLACELEGHPDNVAPALYGGVTAAFVADGEARCIVLAPKAPVSVVVAAPEFKLSTAEARAVLPASVPRADAIANVAAVTALTTVMLTGDVQWLRHALRDRLHQPYRLALIPGAGAVMAAAEAEGAIGCAISGAGPSLLAFVPAGREAGVAAAMERAWADQGVASQAHVFGHAAEPAGAEARNATT